MLNKLLKYDLKWVYKPLLVFYILSMLFSLLTRIVGEFKHTLIVLIIEKVLIGTTIAMIVNILINCFMINWARFIKNMYKDESYLTHTIPESKNKLYLSKILAAFITLITSSIIIIICMAIAFLHKDTWELLKQSLEQSSILLNSSITTLVIIMIITIFFELLSIFMFGILGIILGHRSNNLKIVKSIIFGFIIYIISSILSIGILYISGLFNSNIMDIFNYAKVSSEGIKDTMIVGIFMYAIYNLISYIIGSKVLNKGVNID